MQLEIIILNEVTQKDKDNYHMILLYVKSKIWHRLTYLQSRNRLKGNENRLMVAEGEGDGEGRTGSVGIADVNYYI